MRKITVLSVVLLLILATIPVVAAKLANKQILFPADDVKLLRTKIDLAAGHFKVQAKEMSDVISASVDYNAERVDIYAEYKKRGTTGYLELGSDLLSKIHMDAEDNNWDMALSKKYSSDLDIDLGACEADLDLGGIPIQRLKVDVGAAEGRLVFSEPNPEPAADITIDAGAASFEVEKLGNANFEDLSFDGGLGKFRLDFAGTYKTKSRATVSVGLGKAVIYIPSNLPVRIEAEDNFLSTVKFRNADEYALENGYFESRNFRESKIGLDLKIEIGLGSVEIVWTD